MFQFAEGQVVAATEEYLIIGLYPGDTGVIWALYNTTPPAYEVTFTGKDGRPFDMTMSEDELVAVPAPHELAASRSWKFSPVQARVWRRL